MTKLALGGKAATTTKGMFAVGALKASLLANPFGWVVMITAVSVASVAAAIVFREKSLSAAAEAGSKA